MERQTSASPPPLNPFELMMHHRIAQQIVDAKDNVTYYVILYASESASSLAGAAAECPFFVLMPPTLELREPWPELLKDLEPERTLIDTLTSNWFMPFG